MYLIYMTPAHQRVNNKVWKIKQYKYVYDPKVSMFTPVTFGSIFNDKSMLRFSTHIFKYLFDKTECH